MWYGSWQRTIQHVITIAPVPESREVSVEGDTGSWWLDVEARAAVGLHFAGSDHPEQALAINIMIVLDALAVDIVSERPSPGDRRRVVDDLRRALNGAMQERLVR